MNDWKIKLKQTLRKSLKSNDISLNDQTSGDWISHKHAPCKHFKLYKNNNDIILIEQRCDTTNPSKDVYKFTRNSNTWSKLMKLPNNFMKAYAGRKYKNSSTHFYAAAFDEKHQNIYFVKEVGGDMLHKIFEFNLRTLQFVDITFNLSFKHSQPIFMFMDSTLHILETSVRKMHVFYEAHKCIWKKCIIFKHNMIAGLVYHNYCYSKSKHCLYLFASEKVSSGGYSTGRYYVDTICMYNFSTNQWKKLNIDIPQRFSRYFKIINVGNDDRYKLLVQETNDIFIFDMKWNMIKKSTVNIPECVAKYEIITINNAHHAYIVLCGYIRKIGIKWIATEIMYITAVMVQETYLHIVGCENKERRHLSINLDQVLK